MKIINFKLNISNILICIMIVIALLFFAFTIISFSHTIKPKDVIEMTNKNYTTILKDCHENIDNCINKRVTAVGYIFRAQDFNEKQFVIARDMIINYPYDARIVGFLCECENAKEFENNTWVEITGTIKKGDYYGEIPVIKVETIKKVTTPDDIYVFPPEGFKE